MFGHFVCHLSTLSIFFWLFSLDLAVRLHVVQFTPTQRQHMTCPQAGLKEATPSSSATFVLRWRPSPCPKLVKRSSSGNAVSGSPAIQCHWILKGIFSSSCPRPDILSLSSCLTGTLLLYQAVAGVPPTRRHDDEVIQRERLHRMKIAS